MEQIIDLLKDLINPLEQSVNTYARPLPADVQIRKEIRTTPSHSGPYTGAIDFCVPLGTPVLAARKGRITAVVDIHNKSGSTPDYGQYYNYIQIIHDNNEITEYGHLGPNSSSVKVGDLVEEGSRLAVTGNSGYMTEPHLHFLVYRLTPGAKHDFKGLRPKFK